MGPDHLDITGAVLVVHRRIRLLLHGVLPGAREDISRRQGALAGGQPLPRNHDRVVSAVLRLRSDARGRSTWFWVVAVPVRVRANGRRGRGPLPIAVADLGAGPVHGAHSIWANVAEHQGRGRL